MTRWAAGMGVAMPDYPTVVSAGAALLICLGAWGLALFVGRKAGPLLGELAARVAGARNQTIAVRMCDLTRYATAAVVLAIAIQAEPWPDLPEFILGLAVATAAALLVRGIIRGLMLPRWVAWLLAVVTWVAVLADVIDGLKPVTDVLDAVGFTLGDTRFSLLTLLQIAVALLVLLAALRLASRVINHSIARSAGLDPTQRLLAQKLAGVALLIAAFFVGIDIVGIDLTALAVFSGAFGLAVGFGLQKTFGNLIAGIILLMDRSIKPGDVIAVGETFGWVNKIGVRAVSVVTRDGMEHLIPNENLMTQEVVNWSYSSPDVRIHIPIGVAYGCDLPLAQKLMMEAVTTSPRILDQPEPKVLLREFGERWIEHDIRVWIADPAEGVGNIRSEILNRLWVLFAENGIEIPVPQRDIRIREWPGPPQA
jgi:small-conductance mechanosensitive channel